MAEKKKSDRSPSSDTSDSETEIFFKPVSEVEKSKRKSTCAEGIVKDILDGIISNILDNEGE